LSSVKVTYGLSFLPYYYSICLYFVLGEKQTKNFADQISMPHYLFTGRNGYFAGWTTISPAGRLFRVAFSPGWSVRRFWPPDSFFFIKFWFCLQFL